MCSTRLDTEPALRLSGVSVEIAGYSAIDGVRLQIPMGATLAIMGPSGCGKSTLLKACAGLIPVRRGEVEVLSMDIVHAGENELRALRRRNGFVFQDAALWQNLTVRQNLALPVEYHYPRLDRAEVTRRIERIVDELGYRESLDVRPAQLSAGERKIISFARSLVNDPEIVFMDEPTSFVDGETAERLIHKMRMLKDQSKTLVIATHNASVTSLLADYILVLKKGIQLAFGDTRTVVHSTDPEVVAILSDLLSETATFATEILSLLDRGTDEFFGTDSSTGD